MPCSVFAEMKTASLCWHCGQRTSLVRGSVGSAVTSDTTYRWMGEERRIGTLVAAALDREEGYN